jgi:predicted HTH domain antitoxin
MHNRELTIIIPEQRLPALHVPPEQAAEEVRMLAAVKLYELGRLSTGAAAEFAGIPKPLFLQRLGSYGVSVLDMSEEEFTRETRLA